VFGVGGSHTKHDHARIIYEYDNEKIVAFSARVVDIPTEDQIHYGVILREPVVIDATHPLVLRNVNEETTISVPLRLEPGEYLLSVSDVSTR